MPKPIAVAACALTLSLPAFAAAGAPFVVRTVAAAPRPGATPELAARAALREAVPTGSSVELGAARVLSLRGGGRIVRLPQLHAGLPVAHRGAAVLLDSTGAARTVASQLEQRLPAEVRAAIDARQARATAAPLTGIDARALDARLLVWPAPGEARLAWLVWGSLLPARPSMPVVLVDARSGEPFLGFDAVRHLNQARVYPSNPVRSPGLVQVTLPLPDGATSLQDALVQSLNCIDQKSLRNVQGLDIHVCDLISTAAPDSSGDYLEPPAAGTDPEDAYAQISLYHHARRGYDFFRALSPTLDVNPGEPLKLVSNLRLPQGMATFDLAKMADPNLPLEPMPNAAYSPGDPLFDAFFGVSSGALWFGQGASVDFSYDGDVVYHELTHAVIQATAQLQPYPRMDEYGASAAPGAMNEGLADFFSSVLTGDPDVGEYASTEFGTTAIRSLTSDDSCPASVAGEVHQDATLFSAALWDVRSALAESQRPDFDAAIFATLLQVPAADIGYEQFADLARLSVAASPLGQSAADALQAAFTARGVLPRCKRVVEWQGPLMRGPLNAHGLEGMWMAPGTLVTGTRTYAPGAVQFHAAVPANAAVLRVRFANGPSTSGGMFGSTPFTPRLLVRFAAEPITFEYPAATPPTYSPSVQQFDNVNLQEAYAFSVAVPPGAADVHLMVASLGSSDGTYGALELEFDIPGLDAGTPEPDAGAGSPDSGAIAAADAGSPPPTDAGAPKAGAKEEEGCGCSSGGAGVAAAALLALSALVRRRRG